MKRRHQETVTLSSKGQLVLPARLRKELGLKTGRVLRVRATSDREIVLSLADATSSDVDAMLARAHAWTARTGRDLTAELHAARAREREAEASEQ